jgi:hypothetical protein
VYCKHSLCRQGRDFPCPGPPALDAAPSSDAQEQIVTPWDVHGSISTDGKQLGIDYEKLLTQFGTRRLDGSILAKFEKLTGVKPHPFLRRGLFFSHRCALISLPRTSPSILNFGKGISRKSWIDTSKENPSSSILDVAPAAIVCIWVIWSPSFSQSMLVDPCKRLRRLISPEGGCRMCFLCRLSSSLPVRTHLLRTNHNRNPYCRLPSRRRKVSLQTRTHSPTDACLLYPECEGHHRCRF